MNGLYDYSEPPKLLAERLNTFAISNLHHTNVKMSGGRIFTFEATYDPFSPNRSIIVAAGFNELFGDHSVRVEFPIFESDLAYEVVCGDELKLTNHWNFGVEVGEDWLIHMI